MKRSVLRIALLLILFMPGSCLRTQLSAPELLPTIENLHSQNKRQLRLETSTALSSDTRGYQYMLLFLPFGAVEVLNPEYHLQHALLTALTLKSLRVVAGQGSPDLVVKLQTLRVNAYDFIVLRRISVEMKLLYRLPKTGHESVIRISESRFLPFAFQKELRHVLEKSFRRAASELVRQIGPLIS